MLLKYWMSQLEAAAKADRGKRQAEREERARAEAEARRLPRERQGNEITVFWYRAIDNFFGVGHRD
jgi:hypothetical protein